jgi:uncharacterized protein (TIGR03435 family)
MKTIVVVLVLGTAMIAANIGAGTQAPTEKSGFEVISIKPSLIPIHPMPGSGQTFMPEVTVIGGRLLANNATLRTLTQFAYGKAASRFAAIHTIVGGPAFIDKDHYVVEAKSRDQITVGEAQAMMRSLLAERFGLVVHAEARELSVYHLVIGKSGLKMRQLPPDAEVSLKRDGKGTALWYRFSAPMTAIVDQAQAWADRLVVDQTGLTGMYEQIVVDAPSTGDGAVGDSARASGNMLAIFEDRTGLKLVSAKETVEVLVIDAARPPDSN